MKKRFYSLLLLVALVMTLGLNASATNASTASAVVDGGLSHSIAVDKNGDVYVWGSNANGQLGLGAGVANVKTPTKLESLSGVSAVAAGYNFSMALRYNGKVVIWGNDMYATPTEVAGLENVTAIAAGQMSCMALTVDGAVYQWNVGMTPARVWKVGYVVAIDVGGGQCLALTRSGEVYGWGENSKGQATGIASGISSYTPARVRADTDGGYLTDIVAIAAGATHSLAVDFKGNVYSWGDNTYGQLGREDNGLGAGKVKGVKNAQRVSAGNGSCLAQTSDGKVYAWGYGEYGQIGNNSTETYRDTPVQCSRVSGAVYTACGVYHNLAVNKSGDVYAWGRNQYNQLGTGKNSNGTTAEKVLSGLASDSAYTATLFQDSSAWAQTEIKDLYPRDIVPPSSLGNYQYAITRAQLAHLLVSAYERVKGSEVNYTSVQDQFVDLAGCAEKTSVLKAYALGITSGTSGNTFTPNGYVTRQEAVTMLCRFLGKMKNVKISTTVKSIAYYDDAVLVAEWAAPYVDYANEHGIMKGSDGKFMPQTLFTREQALLTIARLAEENNWKGR